MSQSAVASRPEPPPDPTADPFPVYKALRALGPVHRVTELSEVPGAAALAKRFEPAENVYLVVTRDEVLEVLRDTEHFTADHLQYTPIGEIIRGGWGTDGPDHDRVRKLVGNAFRPRVLERWRAEFVRPLAKQLIAGFADRGNAELVADLATELPIRIISRIIGLPIEKYAGFRTASLDIMDITDDRERALQARDWVQEQVHEAIEPRRSSPGDDLISDLVHVELDGHRLSEEEVFDAVLILMVGGNETTSRALATLVFALLMHPDELGAVIQDRSLIPHLIEETLRWDPPAPLDSRMAKAETVLGGKTIVPGDLLAVCLAAANRDERYHEDPERFWVQRPTSNLHVSFAAGPKFCLGHHLARMELFEATHALLDLLPGLRLDRDRESPSFGGGTGMRGLNHLHVRFDSPKGDER